MKKTILIASLTLGLMACNTNTTSNNTSEENHGMHDGHNHKSNAEDHSGHDHGESDSHEGHNHGDESGHENHKEGLVKLTEEQYNLAGLKTDKLQKQNMGSAVNVSGQIAVPPLGFASVYAPLGGFIKKGDLLPGEFVKKGQILAILEHQEYIQIQEEFLQISAQRQFLEEEYNRQKELQSSDLSSIKTLQQSQLDRELIEAKYQSLKKQLTIIGISINQLKTNGIQNQITINAPISGYITENNIHLGMYVSPNDQLYGIVNKKDMHAELQVYSADLWNIKVGMPFEFTIAGTPTLFKGEIALIGETVDQETKTVDIHGEIKANQTRLKPGMYIDAKIFTGEELTYVVPNSAIFEKEDKKYIFRQISKLEYEILEVKLGKTNDNFTEIQYIQESNFDINIVTKGIYQLESALIKAEGGLGHGHAH